jgi:hypothetical protein
MWSIAIGYSNKMYPGYRKMTNKEWSSQSLGLQDLMKRVYQSTINNKIEGFPLLEDDLFIELNSIRYGKTPMSLVLEDGYALIDGSHICNEYSGFFGKGDDGSMISRSYKAGTLTKFLKFISWSNNFPLTEPYPDLDLGYKRIWESSPIKEDDVNVHPCLFIIKTHLTRPMAINNSPIPRAHAHKPDPITVSKETLISYLIGENNIEEVTMFIQSPFFNSKEFSPTFINKLITRHNTTEQEREMVRVLLLDCLNRSSIFGTNGQQNRILQYQINQLRNRALPVNFLLGLYEEIRTNGALKTNTVFNELENNKYDFPERPPVNFIDTEIGDIRDEELRKILQQSRGLDELAGKKRRNKKSKHKKVKQLKKRSLRKK